MRDYPVTPAGWRVRGRHGLGPFTTAVTFERPGGGTVEWRSRVHRKHASRLSRVRPAREAVLWAPHRASWWIAVLFMVGSACFLVGPLPFYYDLVGGQVVGATFFVGSVFFTSAAALQWLETVNADRHPGSGSPTRLRLVSWEPRRIDWWSSGVQLLGTLFFNVTTFRALGTAVEATSYDKLVWRPDAYGSVCFLVAGYLAYVEVTGRLLRRPPRTLEGWIVAVNLFGCIAFGVSAVAGYAVPATGDLVSATVTNVGTALGALGFLVGAALLLPEGAAQPE